MGNKHLENLKRKKEELEKQIKEEEAKVINKEGTLKFFAFLQNNSGGIFEVNDKIFMLYLGNEVGRYGFGLAELEGELH